VTDRYTKAIEQLGSNKLDVRIGAIYALERIARDSARDHPTVMEVLAAFIREHSREQWPEPEPGGQAQERSTRPDVQAALTAVGRRDARHDIRFRRIDLSRANLPGASLPFANLAVADLRGADLTGADLTGADLSGANLTRANLSRANLESTHLDFADLIGADLTSAYGGSAILTDANLTGADLTGAYIGDDLSHANLTRAKWPEGTTVPEVWKLDTGSGLLQPDPGHPEPGRRFGRKAAGDDSRPAKTN
jgi:Pentapeptide repeats (8 copies)